MNKDYQDYELTAYLLEELDEQRRRELEDILARSPEARAELEEIRESMNVLSQAVSEEPALRLKEEQRVVLEREFDRYSGVYLHSSPRAAKLTPASQAFWRWAGAAAAAAALLVVLVLSWQAVSPPAPPHDQLALSEQKQPEAHPPSRAADGPDHDKGVSRPAEDAATPPRLTRGVQPRKAVELPPAAAAGTQAQAGVPHKPAFAGMISDPSQSPVPGASVMVKALPSGESVSTLVTNQEGRFVAPPLPSGPYSVEAELPGFKTTVVAPVMAEPGKTKELNLALAVGEVASTVVVESKHARPPASSPRTDSFRQAARGKADGSLGRLETDARTAVPAPGETGREFNTEAYDFIAENEFTAVAKDPLSTFSIDVDTASYSNVRRFLREGQLPPPDAVRIEELINYFVYDYEGPRGDTPFAVHTEVSQAPWKPEHRLVRIALKGKEFAPAERPAANLVFLVDVSGSMNSPLKLPLVKEALRLLVDRLDERDRVAIVVYAGASGLVLPSTSGSNKQRIRDALEQLEAGGSTNGGEGIRLAYRQALTHFDRNIVNRVVLCTDGDFNVGVTNQGELVRLVQEQAAQGVFLTVLGFGMGNYKDSMLEKLADKGNGNYAYVDSLDEARKVLVEQAGGTLVTIAKDVKIQVEFNPQEVTAYRLIGYENRVMAHQDFEDDRKDAGEIGAGHTVTALYEVVPAGVQVDLPQGEPLKYQRKTAAATQPGELLTVKLRYKRPDEETSRRMEQAVSDSLRPFDHASADFRFASAVAAFGMLLRNSPHKGSATLETVISIAETSRSFDPQGYRAEFLRLAHQARSLAR